MELITPCTTLCIKGLKAGATLGRIIEALGTDSQDASGIQSMFIHRAPGGDSCTLFTTGPRLLGTPALRPLASSLTPQDEADIEDLRRLRLDIWSYNIVPRTESSQSYHLPERSLS